MLKARLKLKVSVGNYSLRRSFQSEATEKVMPTEVFFLSTRNRLQNVTSAITLVYIINQKKGKNMDCLTSSHLSDHYMLRFHQRVLKQNYVGYSKRQIKAFMLDIMSKDDIKSFNMLKNSFNRVIIPFGTKYRAVVTRNILITVLIPDHEYKTKELQ